MFLFSCVFEHSPFLFLFLKHFYFLCVSLFNIVYFLNVSLFWRLVDHPFSALFLFSLFYIFTFFLSEKTKLVSVFTVFFETRNGVAQLFLFFSFSKIYSLMFSPSSCFSILWKRLFYWRFVFAHFETSFFYLHFFSHQKYVQHFPFRNVSFTSLIPPFVHPLSTCFFFFVSQCFRVSFTYFSSHPKISLSFGVSLFSLSITFFTVFCIFVNFCKTIFSCFLFSPEQLGVVCFFFCWRLFTFVCFFFSIFKKGVCFFFYSLFWFFIFIILFS